MNQYGMGAAGAGGALREHTIRKCGELIDAGQYSVGIPLLRETLAKSPSDPRVLHMLGSALAAFGDLKFAGQLRPNDAEIFLVLSTAHRKMNQLREAHQAVDKALKINPRLNRAISFKATLYQTTGQAEKALAYVQESMGDDRDGVLAVLFGKLARQLKRTGEGIDTLKAALERPEILPANREEMNFVLGHLYDASGEYDLAFERYERGNRMSGVQDESEFEQILVNCRQEVIDSIPSAEADGSRAVFVVGMPRSGTTLTEQIIASHPQAGGVGESSLVNEIVHEQEIGHLTQKMMDTNAGRYLAMLNDAYPDPKILRVCDKMPENFFFLGVMSKMLPGASYVHCVRDARDTCLSIYFQQFGARQGYARGQESCAKQYLGYLRMMDHWREILDISILDSSYEDLTSDPENGVRGILEHIGLGFDPACMEHHKNKSTVHTASMTQVRNPIYKSSQQRWKNYEKHIGPMLEILDGV
jgi:tetratricopeptide (TPR) repeat protein